MTKTPTIDRLRAVLRYDQESGKLFWLAAPSPMARVVVGNEAGRVNKKGYVYVTVDGAEMLAHRVIFAIVKGRWPTCLVDHKDRAVAGNRWTNLRDASHAENIINSKLSKASTTGLKGISKKGNGFRSYICFKGRQISLGTYPTPEQAHAAYVAKAKELYGEFARAA